MTSRHPHIPKVQRKISSVTEQDSRPPSRHLHARRVVAGGLLGVSRLCLAAVAGALALPAGASASPELPQPDSLNVFYFGNSLTGSTAPELHEKLGLSAGKKWKYNIMAVAGGQLWQYRDAFELDSKIENVGDYTIDAKLVERAPYAARLFLEGKWDAVVLQPFGAQGLKRVATEMWGKKFDQERDFGDLAAAKYLIDLAVARNPGVVIFIYQDWPSLQLVNRAIAPMRLSGLELSPRQMKPIARSWDYPRAWLREPDWQQRILGPLIGSHTRAYRFRLMEELIAAYPKLWETGRLRMIPVGDIQYVLDRKSRADLFPGIENQGEFYSDDIHQRAGVPAYTGAAAFFSMLFGQKPHSLDFNVYNDPSVYGMWNPGEDAHNDSGELIPLTSENSAILNNTIWEVLQAHPYTRLSAKGSKDALAALEESIPAPKPFRVIEFGDWKLWSTMPIWQAALDRTAGRHSAWWPEIEFGRGTFSMARLAASHPPVPNEATMGLDEEMHPPAVHNDALAVQIGGFSEAEYAGFVTLARRFLKTHPEGLLMGVFTWPDLPGAGELRRASKIEDWQLLPEEEINALRKAYDFVAAHNAGAPTIGTRKAMEDFVSRLRTDDPDLAEKFRAIPASSLMAALDTKLKSGVLPGCGGVGEFYKDEVLLRTGLPRYAMAALRYAVLFNADPAMLDPSFFNDTEAYPPDSIDPSIKRGKGKNNVILQPSQFNNGPHFPITPEGKQLIDQTIIEVLRQNRGDLRQ